MADSTSHPKTSHVNRLTCAFDAGFLTNTLPSDSANSLDLYDDETPNTDSETADTDNEATRSGDLSASVRMLSQSWLRLESTEMEMVKSREALRLEVERKRVESENELNRLLIETQLKLVAGMEEVKSQKRKRKRGEEVEQQQEEEEEDSLIAHRQGLLMLALLQCNMSFWI